MASIFVRRRVGSIRVHIESLRPSSKIDVSKTRGFVYAKQRFLKTRLSCTRNHYFSRVRFLCAGAWDRLGYQWNPCACRRKLTPRKLVVSCTRGEGDPSKVVLWPMFWTRAFAASAGALRPRRDAHATLRRRRNGLFYFYVHHRSQVPPRSPPGVGRCR